MFPIEPVEPEAFTVRDVARAAGTPARAVRALLEAGQAAHLHYRFLHFADAVRLVRTLRLGTTGAAGERRLFGLVQHDTRPRGMPLVASGVLHAGLLAFLVLVSGLGVGTKTPESPPPEAARLVFVAAPGPGGGGGGGGLRQRLPPPRAQLKGASRLRSPVSVTRSVERDRKEPEPRVVAPPAALPESQHEPAPLPPRASNTPPVAAPVVSVPADTNDRTGVTDDTLNDAQSHGPGSGGGTGTGRGSGSGAGDGAGLGDGAVAGIGGGPYRPGSGITPPALEREVKPIYTDEGRRRGVEGAVIMEVVVRADGSVGDIRILQGLDAALDRRAADAVRQWRFSPARRFGTPVDVLVEVAVEFRLR